MGGEVREPDPDAFFANRRADIPGELTVLNPAAWDGQPVPGREFMVEGALPSRNVTMLNGDGGLGKTLLGLQLAVAVWRGDPWLGHLATTQGPVVGLFAEDERDELHRRLSDIVAHEGCRLADLGGLHLVSRVDQDCTLMEFDRSHRGKTTTLYDEIGNLAVQVKARLLILDALYDVFAGDEINRVEARRFIAALRHWAMTIGGAVLLTAHPSISGLNSGSGTSGSTAWNNACRSRLYLTRPPKSDDNAGDDSARVLKTMKANYGPRAGDIDLVWRSGVFVPTQLLESDPFGVAEAAFLDCLKKVEREGRYASASAGSPNYAPPRLFAEMSRVNRGCNAGRLRRAMESLFARDRIVVREVRKPNRHSVSCIVRAT